MKHSLILIISLITLSFSLNAQDKINWLTLEEAVKLNEEVPKKIVIDVYTKWCGWCKKMDKTTFQDPHVIAYINKNYYAVKFNAEQKESLKFKDQTFKYINKGKNGYHQLAPYLLQGKMSFPSFVFLDESLETIQPISSYIESQKFLMISSYFAENHYTNTPWHKYAKAYRRKHGITKN